MIITTTTTTKNQLTDIENKLVVTRGKQGRAMGG